MLLKFSENFHIFKNAVTNDHACNPKLSSGSHYRDLYRREVQIYIFEVIFQEPLTLRVITREKIK